MRHCAWEDADFPAADFDPYRGLIYLHRTMVPAHLTNGELADGEADAGVDTGGGGDVDVSPEAADDGQPAP